MDRMKWCSKCYTEKKLSCFGKQKTGKDGLRSTCLECHRKANRIYHREHREQEHLYHKKRYEMDRDRELERQKTYRLIHADKRKESVKKYCDKNREKLNAKSRERNKTHKKYFNDYRKRKRDESGLYRLKDTTRTRTGIVFRKLKKNKPVGTLKLLGCSWDVLKQHIENQFTDGMSWERLGKEIHIDHIIPLSSAKNMEEIIKLCHYTNLQPLWAIDNLRKHNKILRQVI